MRFFKTFIYLFVLIFFSTYLVACVKTRGQDEIYASQYLSLKSRDLYNNICIVIENQGKSLVFKEPVNEKVLSDIFEAIKEDKPEYFWFDNYIWVYSDNPKNAESIELEYSCSKEERTRRQVIIDDYFSRFLSGINQKMSEYDKVKYTHDYIVTNTDYDLNSVDNQNICSVFINGKSVCAGYAKAFQYLLKKININCTYVSGEAVNRGRHAWNLVRVDKEFYYVDVTWDDPTFEDANSREYISYNYFCVTTEEIEKTHTFDGNIIKLPNCTATKNNYFTKNSLFFSDLKSGSITKLKSKVKASLDSGISYFASKYSSNELMDEALEIVGKFEFLNSNSITWEYQRL